jgi:hypothetical protein
MQAGAERIANEFAREHREWVRPHPPRQMVLEEFQAGQPAIGSRKKVLRADVRDHLLEVVAAGNISFRCAESAELWDLWNESDTVRVWILQLLVPSAVNAFGGWRPVLVMIGNFAGTLESVSGGDGASESERKSMQVAGVVSDLRTAGCTGQRG